MITEYVKCLSVAETAHLLGICKTKVYAMIRGGSIPHLRIGRRIVIPTAALRKWMQTETEGVVTACHR